MPGIEEPTWVCSRMRAAPIIAVLHPRSWRHPICNWSRCWHCTKVTWSQCWMAWALYAALVPAANKGECREHQPSKQHHLPCRHPKMLQPCTAVQWSPHDYRFGSTSASPLLNWAHVGHVRKQMITLRFSRLLRATKTSRVVQRSKACLGLLWVGREPKGAAGKQQVAQSQKLAAFPGIPACILEVKLHFNPSGFPSSGRLCEYLFDKQAVKCFPLDLIGEEFTFLLTASPSLGVHWSV